MATAVDNTVPLDASRQPIVLIKDNEAFADSRDVAAYFKKSHAHVLRDIRALHCSDDFRRANFGSIYIKDLTGETTSHVMMTKDGFLFLVLGFGGDAAGKLKEAYINQFNAMLAELKRRADAAPPIDFTNPKILLGCFQALQAQVIEKDEEIAAMRPKAEALDRIAEHYGSHCRTNAAKILGVPPQALIRWLRTNGWTYRLPGDADDIGYQSKISAGLLEHKIASGVKADGTEWTSTSVRITAKGITVLAKAFPLSAKAVA